MVFFQVLVTGPYYTVLLAYQHVFHADDLHLYLVSPNELYYGNAGVSRLWNLNLAGRTNANDVRREFFLQDARNGRVYTLVNRVRIQTGLHVVRAADELSRLDLH